MNHLPPALRFLEANAWALQPRVFEALAELVQRHADGVRFDAAEVAAATGADAKAQGPREPSLQVIGSTAVVSLRGVLARYSDQVNGICQPTGRSAEALLADLQAAEDNAAVQRVVLRIDSPGGTVAGTAEVADAVRALSASGKAVYAFVDGLAASAAYWIASQADEVIASSAAATVGSIGVVAALVEREPEKGTKVRVLRSAALKAPGTAGEAVSPEQLASMQRLIDDLAGAFAQAVGGGRGLTAEQQTAVATGEVFAAARAMDLGLIDGVASWSAFLARIAGEDMRTVRGTAVQLIASLSPAAGMSPEAPTAGPAPASTPDTPAGTDTMRITAAVLAALVASAPEHAALIASMANGDPAKGQQPATEDEIRASITTARHKALNDRVLALEAEAKAAADAHKAAIAAKDQEMAALRAELAKAGKVVAIAAGAAQDPGADAKGAAAPTDASLRAEWQAMSAAKRAGYFNDFDAFKSERTENAAAPAAGKEA